jgi:hypothetical protein
MSNGCLYDHVILYHDVFQFRTSCEGLMDRWNVCMFIYIRVYIGINVSVYVCMYICVSVHMYVSIYVCTYVRMYACIRTNIPICIYLCTRTRTCTYVFFMYVCIYLYMHV